MKLMYGSLVSLFAVGLLQCGGQPLEQSESSEEDAQQTTVVSDLEESNTPCSMEQHNIHINLSGAGLQSLPNGVVDSPNVVSLDLSNNNINAISKNAFGMLSNLQTLDLSNNAISIDEVFSRLNSSNLLTLKLQFLSDRNSYHYYEKSFDLSYIYLPRLQRLDLQGSGHHIIKLKLNTIAPQLTHLDLSRSRVTSDNFMNDIPSTITHLNLDHTGIQDASTDKLVNIEDLSLNHNRFTTLCFDGCYIHNLRYWHRSYDRNVMNIGAKTLKRLQLSDNRIQEILIGDVSHSFDLLEFLDLSHNQISDITFSFNELFPNLTHLSLSNNLLQSMPNMCSMSFLEIVDLSNNNLESFMLDSMCSYENLKVLRLQNNRISAFSGNEFNIFPALIDLNLSNNSLVALEEGWIQAGNKLEILRLTDNLFRSLDKLNLSELHHLRELYVQNNPLFFIRAIDIVNVSENVTIYLNGPPTDSTTHSTSTSTYNDYFSK